MKLAFATVAAVAALMTASFGARADNLEKLEGFHMTAPVDWPTVPQTGPKADAVKETLKKIKLPAGLPHRALRAGAGRAPYGGRPAGRRHLRRHPQDQGLGRHRPSRAGVADEVKEFAPTLPKRIPNGACFSKDGFLYIVEQNRVLQYPAAEFFYEGPDVAVGVVVPQGQLIPKAEESFNHTARDCRVGPDNKLYIQLGQPFNVPAKDKVAAIAKIGLGGIIRMDQDGKNREIYAHGCAIPSASTSTRRTRRSGPTTIRSTAWATTSRRAR